jgi:hypothetical protein
MYRPVPRGAGAAAAVENLAAVEIAVERPALDDRQFGQIGLSPSSTTCWQIPLRTVLGGSWPSSSGREALHLFHQRRGISGFTSCCTRSAGRSRLSVPSAWLTRQ